MAKPGIKELHDFINNDLRKEILKRYESFNILSEADLQTHVWQILSEFLKRVESKPYLHKVLNKPYLKELKTHPDIVIFRRNKPWIMIELKEWKRIRKSTVNSAKKEFQRLLKARKHFKSEHDYKLRRGYLLYVSPYGSNKILPGHKGKGARFFFEIPIVLEKFKTKDDIKRWEAEFRKWAKYISEPKKGKSL